MWSVLVGCWWWCAVNHLPTTTWLLPQNQMGAFTFVWWGSPVVSLPSGLKWWMNSPWGQQCWALTSPCCRSAEKNPGGRPFSSYCSFAFPCGFRFLGLRGSRWSYLHSVWHGSSLVRTSSSVNDVSSSIDSLNSIMHSTSWHIRLTWQGTSWAFSTQNCSTLPYTKVLSGWWIL